MTMFCYAAKIPKANQIGFGIGPLKCKVPQRDVRLFLVLIHLIVLVSAIATFTAARCSETSVHIHYLRMSTEMEEISMHDGVTMKKYLTISQQELTSAIHNHIEAILYITSFNLLLYWLIYGVAVAYKFGGMCEMCILIVSVPHTVVMVVWELGLAAFFVKIEHVGFYATWAPTLATIFIVTCVVQLGTAMLPFLMSGSTSVSQNMDGIFTIGRHLHRNGELPLTIEQTRREPGRREIILATGRHTQQPGDRETSSPTGRHTGQSGAGEHPSTTGQHSRQPGYRELPLAIGRHPDSWIRHVNNPEYVASGRNPQQSGDSWIRHANNPEYVEFNPFESSLYLTEMPDQILRREKHGCVARLRKISIRTEQGVLDNMNQVYSESGDKDVDNMTQVYSNNGYKAVDNMTQVYSNNGDKAVDTMTQVYSKNQDKPGTCGDSHQYNLPPSHIYSNIMEDYMYMKGEMPLTSYHLLSKIV